MNRRQKRVLIVSGAAALVLLLILIIMAVMNRKYIEMSIPESQTLEVQYGDDFKTPDVTAVYRGTIINKKGKKLDVTVSGSVDTKQFGHYELEYTAKYKDKSAVAYILVDVVDTAGPVITLNGGEERIVSPLETYVEEGYTAIDNYDGDVTDKVVCEEMDGEFVYTVTDSHGNTSTVVRRVIYKDEVPPVITLTGDKELAWQVGQEYEEPGVTAVDDCEGDISGRIEVSGTVDTSVEGEYELVYRVKDQYGNEASETRKVVVRDTQAPLITLLNGDVYLKKGETYSDPGYTAEDLKDGDVTGQVMVSGTVDTGTEGTYKITYEVTDSSGNKAIAIRKVYVYENLANIPTSDPGDKVVYLTFDDGPGPYTEKLLDVLDKYNVKVTFFVTNQYPKYQDLMAEEAKRGHTVAIHSYSHKYPEIYASETNYFADLNKMSDIIESQTGEKPMIVRFPGGSSNGISRKYCVGIMTKVTQAVTAAGYKYCDWNVLSGDAGETEVTSEVVQNVIEGMKSHKVSYVLQHDVKEFSVDAVEEIIKWGLANGYTFLPLEYDSPMLHHRVNN